LGVFLHESSLSPADYGHDSCGLNEELGRGVSVALEFSLDGLDADAETLDEAQHAHRVGQVRVSG